MTDHPDSILRHRAFLLFWFARVCAAVGYQMLAVAIGWQLYELTGNPLDLGLVGLVQFIPAVALVLVIGQVADRHDRRKVLMACQAIQAATGGMGGRGLVRLGPKSKGVPRTTSPSWSRR